MQPEGKITVVKVTLGCRDIRIKNQNLNSFITFLTNIFYLLLFSATINELKGFANQGYLGNLGLQSTQIQTDSKSCKNVQDRFDPPVDFPALTHIIVARSGLTLLQPGPARPYIIVARPGLTLLQPGPALHYCSLARPHIIVARPGLTLLQPSLASHYFRIKKH